MKKFDCVTIGGATRDIIFRTDDYCIELEDRKQCYMCFEYGRKIIPQETHFTFGGGALNSAVSMARQGLFVAPIVNVGSHESSTSLLNHMKLEKLNVSLVHQSTRKGDYRGISVLIVDKGKDHTALLHRGTNDKLKITDWSFLKKTGWLYVTSLSGKSDLVLKDLAKKIKNSKVKFAWNPGSTQLKKGYKALKPLLRQTEILILNKHEAHDLICSREDKIQCSVGSMVNEIKSWGPKYVVITDGANGAQVAFDGEVVKVKAYKVKNVVDTTGAGDAFGSTFTAGLISGRSAEDSLKLASINAASVVTAYGAQEGLLKKNICLKKLRNYK